MEPHLGGSLALTISPMDLKDASDAAEDHHVVVFQRADPLKFRQIKLHFFLPGELAQIDVVVRRENRQSVRLGNAPDVVCGGDRACSRHILDDNLRVARYIFADMPGHHSCRPVIASTRAQPHDDTDLFPLVERIALSPDQQMWKTVR